MYDVPDLIVLKVCVAYILTATVDVNYVAITCKELRIAKIHANT